MRQLLVMGIAVCWLAVLYQPVLAQADDTLSPEQIAFLQQLAACEEEYDTPVPQTIRGVLWNPFCCFSHDDSERVTCLQTNLTKMKDLQRHMQDVYNDASNHSQECGSILTNVCSIEEVTSADDYIGEISCQLRSYNQYHQGLISCVEGSAGARLN